MSALILPSKQVVQPQYVAGVDWGNPITRGLVALVNGYTMTDAVSGRLLTLTGGTDRQTGANGSSLVMSGTQYASLPLAGMAGSYKTLFALANPSALTGAHIMCGLAHSGSSSNVAEIYLNNEGRALFFENNSSSGSDQVITSPGVVSVGSWQSVFGRTSAAGHSVITNRNSTGPDGNATLTQSVDQFNIGVERYNGSYGNQFKGQIPIAACWNRALSDAEVAELQRNPWQLFRPVQRRIWVAVASSGGASGSLAATESGSDSAALSASMSALSGSLASTESGSDAASLSASVLVAGSLAATEAGADTAALSASALAQGALSATETGADTLAATGSMTALAGTLSATESGADAAAMTGTALAQGALAAAEAGGDTFSATSGTPALSGSLAATESGSDTASATASATVTGSVGAVESGSDTASMTGLALVLGLFAASESGSDTAAMTGSAGALQAAGTLAAVESGADVAAVQALALIAGAMAAAESGQDTFSSARAFQIVNDRTTVQRLTDRTTVQRAIDRTTVQIN